MSISVGDAVTEALKAAPGGRAYFDALDERLREPGYFEAIEAFIRQQRGYVPPAVVSGQFGRAYAEWRHATNRPRPTVLPGSLKDAVRMDREDLRLWPGSQVVFIDDSIYSGDTRAQVERWLAGFPAELLGTYVLYDGAPERIPGVHALYRWHP